MNDLLQFCVLRIHLRVLRVNGNLKTHTYQIFHITFPTSSQSMKRAIQNALYRSDAEMQSYAEQLCETLRLSGSAVKGKLKSSH
jgi:flavin-binding protein dodecin